MNKKTIHFLCTITLILSITGCGAADADNSTTENKGKDYTVQLDSAYDVNKENASMASGGFLDYAYPTDLNSMVENSSVIAEGVIQSVDYTAIDHNAWIKLDVSLTESYRGGFAAGDTISIYSMGGYIAAKDAFSELEGMDSMASASEDQWILELDNGIDLPEEGQSYLFFLTEDDLIPAGCYEAFLGYSNAFYTIDGNTYRNDYNSEVISKEDFSKMLG